MMDKTKGMIWIASYPRSGNTWTRLFIANLLSRGIDHSNPLSLLKFQRNHVEKKYVDQMVGFNILSLSISEWKTMRPEIYRREYELQTQSNFYKTHQAYQYFENGNPLIAPETMFGFIYLIRNPLDVAVSLSNFCQKSIDTIIEVMREKNPIFLRASPYMNESVLSWSDNVKSWIEAKNIDGLVLRYEDMKLFPQETFTKLVNFLNIKKTENEILDAVKNVSFNRLKQSEAKYGFAEIGPDLNFFRKGVVGDWKNMLHDYQVKQIIADHGEMMNQFGYLDEHDNPC